LFTNLKQALAVLPPSEPVLVLASDLPLLTRAALADFIRQCREREAEIYYPIIRREVYEEAYPGSRRTYVRVKDGTFTGGNVAFFTPDVFFRHEKLFARAIACRKNPFRLAPLLGFRWLPQLLVRALSVAAIEARIAARLGVKVAAIESRFSEMGFDVDTEADLEWIEFYWGGALAGQARIEPEFEGECPGPVGRPGDRYRIPPCFDPRRGNLPTWFNKRVGMKVAASAAATVRGFYRSPGKWTLKNLSISMGRGKMTVEFFSTAISERVCR
ncbi:MAG: hypothetical protein GX493_05760, partial [Firmicutes bacterium]|nr:hypothetical protein [Bacillota bacterium]